jgi:leucyl-tRNA synthetase
VAPYAPHIAEELWERLGQDGSVMDAGWPRFDEALAREDTIKVAVQVNGKLRGTLSLTRDVDQATAQAAAMAEPSIAKFVTGQPRKVVFVPGRLLNLVI